MAVIQVHGGSAQQEKVRKGERIAVRTDLGNTGSDFPGQLYWLVDEHVGGNGDIFGVGACDGEPDKNDRLAKQTAICETKDLISKMEFPLPSLRCLFHDAGELNAQGFWCLGRNRILSFALEQVHAIDSKGLDLHNDFGGPGLGIWYITNK